MRVSSLCFFVEVWNATRNGTNVTGTKQKEMENELRERCINDSLTDLDMAHRANLKRQMLWSASYKLHSIEVPTMNTTELEMLTELAFLSRLPSYRHITLLAHANVLQELPDAHKRFFSHIVRLAERLDAHGNDDLATDVDWEEWIESM